MRLVILGMPGAGKGTQADLLEQKYGIAHVSTGEMFRRALQSDTEVGRKARVYMERGELVPDSVAIEIVRERLREPDCQEGFALDGFPRTVNQAKDLDRILTELGQELEAAVYIKIEAEEAIRRIAARRVCQQCGAMHQHNQGQDSVCHVCGGPLVQRPDDREETARRRLEVYLEQTHPVVNYYAARGLLVEVNGGQPVAAVCTELCGALEQRGVRLGAGGMR